MRSVEYLKSQGVDVDKSLEIFGDIETYNSSIGEFIVGVSEKVNKMNAYRISKDMKNYSIFAHSLKSDAKYFGFNKLSDLALEMENKSKEMDLYYVNNNFNDLNDIANAFLDTVKASGYEGLNYGSANYHKYIWNTPKYDTWLAWYTKNNTFEEKHYIWQATSSGKVPGISGRADLNVLYLK